MKAKTQKAAKCMGSISLRVQELLNDYPPDYVDPRKKSYYEQAHYFHRKQNGIVKVSRWTFDNERKSPIDFTKHQLLIHTERGFYKYEEGVETDKIWWVNFADENLFGYYDSELFAQDEIQTLEHPLLGSIVEYLDANKIPNLISKTEEKNIATPYLVENIPYWISVNVNPVLPSGEIADIYGRRFSLVEKSIVDLGIKVVQKDKKNNIIAMAAPCCGKGNYTENQLRRLMETVIVAFGAAVKQSAKQRYDRCVIHTGNWGCGAFGNDKELMYLSQILASSFVGVDELIFHNPDEETLKCAVKKYTDFGIENLILFLKEQNYLWQESDGN